MLFEFAVLSDDDVLLVLDAGDDRFCDTVDEALACLPCGEVLTDNGDVLDVTVALLLVPLDVWVLFSGGLLRVGPPPVVLRSWGDATLVEDVESAYLQLADGFCCCGASRPGD